MAQSAHELYKVINAGRPTVAVPAVLLHIMPAAHAVLLAQILFWCDQAGGLAKATCADIELATGLDRHQQLRIIRQLATFGLRVERKGFPAINWFSVDLDALATSVGKARVSTDAAKPRKRENAATGTQMREIAPSVRHETAHLISTNKRVFKEGEGDSQMLQIVTSGEGPPNTQIETRVAPRVEAREGLTPTSANPYPQDSFRQGLEAEQQIQAAAPRLGARLVELRRISGRTEHNYRLWLRDFVVPHIQRLGPAFATSLESALKQGVLANPQYALRDVVKSLEAASPPPIQAIRKQTEADLLDDLIARLAAGPLTGGSHGPN